MPTNNKSERLITAAAILGVASLLSRIVGLIRERILTTIFGAGDIFDAFVAAFRIPDLVFNLIVVGALSAAFIPLFTEKLVNGKKDEQDAFVFASFILNIIVIVVSILCVFFIFFADNIIPLITPGFSADKLRLTVQLARVMALQPILLGISFVLSGVLNSFKKFFAYALAPIFYNLGIIFGVLVLVPLLGISGLAWGVVLGGALHILIQVPSVLRVGFRWQPVFRYDVSELKKLWRMTMPRLVGLMASQVNLLTVTVIGSGLLTGSITVFHLANNVQFIPVGIFGLAFAQAAFPTLAEQSARRQQREFKHTLTKVFRYILFFVIPISLFIYILRAQIVRVVFGDGAFDWEDTILTLETLGWLAMSIFAQSTTPLLARAFYAQHNTKIPVVASVISMTLNIFLAFWLAPSLGVQGLAIAFSLSAIVNLAVLLGVLHWRLQGFDDRAVLFSLARISLAALAAGFIVQLLKYPVAAVVDMQRFWGIFTQLVVTSLAGGVVYLASAWVLKSDELVAIRKYFPRRAKINIPSGTSTSRFEGTAE